MDKESVYYFTVENNHALTCVVPIKLVDPYKYTHICIVSGDTSVKRILGYVEYDVVFKANGEVFLGLLSKSLPRQEEQLHYVDEFLEVQDLEPFVCCAFFFKKTPSSIFVMERSTLELVQARADYIINNILLKPRKGVMEPDYNVVSVMWCAILPILMQRLEPPPHLTGDQVEQDLLHASNLQQRHSLIKKFDNQRLLWEKEQFDALIEPFLQQGAEKQLLKLLTHHGLTMEALREHYVVDGTVDDNRVNMERGLYKPLVYFKVKLKGVPSMISQKLPLYPGGYLHVHPLDMGEWMWQRSVMVWRNIKNNMWVAPRERIDERLFMLAERVYNSLKNNRLAEFNANGTRKRKKSSEGKTLTGVTLDVLPPCMQFNRWVKDGERTKILWSLRQANVDIEDCAEMFYQMHLKEFPASTKQDTMNKWNVFNYKNGKAYGAPGCKAYVANRAEKTGDIIRCPYKGATVDDCKQQCMADFRARFKQPPHYATAETLYGPVKYIELSYAAIEYEKKHS